jgi:protein tyrosine/serine phosphatase
VKEKKHYKRQALLITFLVIAIVSGIAVFLSLSGTMKGSITEQPFLNETGHEVSLPEGARISEKIFGLPGLSNVGRVSSGIYRGAQPEREGYATLKNMGIRTVVNLRSQHSEREEVKAAGMRSVEIPINAFKGLNSEVINKVINVMTNPEYQPVFIHCKLGEDRTGAFVAIYRMELEGWTVSEAETEMQAFGFNDIWVNLKNAVRKYAKYKNKKRGNNN